MNTKPATVSGNQILPKKPTDLKQRDSDLYQLKIKVEEAERQNRDLIEEIVADLELEIQEALKVWEALSSQTK